MDTDLSAWSQINVEEGEEQLVMDLTAQEMDTSEQDFVAGGVLGKHKIYEELGADPYIIQCVREGYKLVLDSQPPNSFTKNNKSALREPEFVRSELKKLEQLNCIKRTTTRPSIVLPLSLVFSNKWRVCLDCSRGLNPFCTTRRITLADLTHVSRTVQKGDYMVVNDLTSGYWQVPVHPDDQDKLGFQFEDENGRETFYTWSVLVLGLKDAVYFFTRLTAPLMATLRKEGFRGQIYIDDVLTTASTLESALHWEKRLYQVFQPLYKLFEIPAFYL